MSSFISSSSLHSSGSPSTIQDKLQEIWKKIQYCNPLLASLVDLGSISDIAMTIVRNIKVGRENILKQLGTCIDLRLLTHQGEFYFNLVAAGAQIWAKIDSGNVDKIANNTTTTAEEATGNIANAKDVVSVDTSNKESDDFTASERSTLQSKNWPNIIYSVIETALNNFSITPRYNKEVVALLSRSSVIESTLAITRGDVLCVNISRAGLVTPFFHFGVYVGKMKTKDGTELEHGVIDLVKIEETKSVSIRAVPLEGDKIGTCFVLNKKNEHLPLVFKVVYEKQTQAGKDKAAEFALEFYQNSECYLKEYNLISNNCEHFVNLCVFGQFHCEQLREFVMTTTNYFFSLATKIVAKVVKSILEYIAAEILAIEPIATPFCDVLNAAPWLAEALTFKLVIVECAVKIVYNIYLLKTTNRLTKRNVEEVIVRYLIPMSPELVVAGIWLVLAIVCFPTGLTSALLTGLPGSAIMIALRYFARSRIEQWIERGKAARLEDFLQWDPHEVARLTMNTSEEDDAHEEILANFKSKNLSGEAVRVLINLERQNPFENHLVNTFAFLDPNRLNMFKQNLKIIFGPFDISEHLINPITLTYNKQEVSVKISDMSTITVRKLLNIARLNWQTDFVNGHWQLKRVSSKDGQESVIASYEEPNSLEREIDTELGLPTVIMIHYVEKSPGCTLL